jgi:hypothetical protein
VGPTCRMPVPLPESRPHVATPTHSDGCEGELLAWGADIATDRGGEAAHTTVTWGRSGARELRTGLQTRAAFKTLDYCCIAQEN